jgi:phytoene dehydrogenase-like protein
MDPVIIVGGGLAGLSAARDLTAAGREVRVLEASDDVGGRVRTDIVDGFRLDRGFQVLLTAYPTTQAMVSLDALAPRPFYSGALVLADGRMHRIADPLRHPIGALASARSPLTRPRDVLALGRLGAQARGPLADVMSAPETTAEQALRDAGVSERLLDAFFRPFFGGVFLDRELHTTSRMLHFLLRMFAKGQVVVPELGMGEIPRTLAAPLPPGTVALNAHVTAASATEVTLEGGETLSASAVIIATDGSAAAALTEGIQAPRWCQSTTLYFAAKAAPSKEPTLFLDGDGTGPLNSVAIMSNVSPAYAPAGQALISASIVGPPPQSADPLRDRVRSHLTRFFGPVAEGFRHLRTYEIRHGLPAQPPGWMDPPARPVRLPTGVYVCGDHRDNGSIEGAIVSGRRAAQAVLQGH